MKTVILIGAGVASAAALFYFLNKNKAAVQLLPGSPDQTPAPSPILPAAQPTKQTMWKDRDGNIFQLTSIKQRWGFVIRVNGAIQEKNNQMEIMFLGPEGYVIGADNNGSVFVYKNGWQYVIRDNKTEAGAYLVKHGQPNVYEGVSGLGCYLMS